jgi:hypothetical protein
LAEAAVAEAVGRARWSASFAGVAGQGGDLALMAKAGSIERSATYAIGWRHGPIGGWRSSV